MASFSPLLCPYIFRISPAPRRRLLALFLPLSTEHSVLNSPDIQPVDINKHKTTLIKRNFSTAKITEIKCAYANSKYMHQEEVTS